MKFLKILSISLSLSILSGCSIRLLPPTVNWDGDQVVSNVDCSKREKLTFYHLWPRGDSGYTMINEIIDEFNKSKEAQKYNVCVTGNGVNFWDYWSKVDNAIAGGTSPDIYLHTLDQVGLRANAKNLLDVNKLYNQDLENNSVTLNPKEDFYDAQLDVATIDGALYALPWSATVRVIYYNKTLFDEAGIDYTNPPKSWSELAEMSNKLTKYTSDGMIEQLGFDPLSGEGQYFHQWAWLNGGDFWIEESGKIKPNFNSSVMIDTMNQLMNFPNRKNRDLLEKFMSKFGVMGVDPFVSGSVGMQIGNEGTYFTLEQANVDFEYGVFPLPTSDTYNDKDTLNWSSSFSIELFDNHKRNNANTEIAESRNQGSWAFVKHLFSRESQEKLYENAPFLLPHKQYLLEFCDGNEVITALANEVKNSVEKEFIPMSPSWTSDINIEINEIYKGNLSPTEGLKRIQDMMLRKIDQYCSTNKGSKGC